MHNSAVLFDKEHVKSIEFAHRIPPTSIGVRRTRPSSKVVMKELKTQQRAKKQQKLDASKDDAAPKNANSDLDEIVNAIDHSNTAHIESQSSSKAAESEVPAPATTSSYFQLQPDKGEVQEEIDEILSADRAAYKNIPAYLTAPMVTLAQKKGLLGAKSPTVSKLCTDLDFAIDDELAQEWSNHITKAMAEAEEVRAKEDMRPMAYKLVPEPWKRLRESCKHVPSENAITCSDIDTLGDVQNAENYVLYADNIRARKKMLDVTHSIFYDCLYHQFPNLHISCGAKFGSDYLLYDGNRKERHAFAGVRILTTEVGQDGQIHYPLPTPYDLHGFVRCLNTAGKLALLATVVTLNEGDQRVVVVDLALEKILSAPTHLRKQNGSKEARKKVGENLAKYA
jgi:hypothetical protein